MRIALITSEVVPFSKTGGLADVCGALPAALVREGAEVVVFTPLYQEVRKREIPLKPTPIKFEIPLAERRVEGTVLRGELPGTSIPVAFIRQDAFFDRAGLYGSPQGDHPDNASRFIFFCRAALEAAAAWGGAFDVFHIHDWQASLVPIYLKTLYRDRFPGAASVITIHNMAYQGLFWHWDMNLTGLDWRHYTWKEMEFYGKINFLKTGLVHADAITTVSPTYAKEIQTSEQGCGLEGVLRERAARVRGILNGVDYEQWDPQNDRHLPQRYSSVAIAGKAACKAALQKEAGLAVRKEVPLFGSIGRLAEQKGVELLIAAIEALRGEEVQWVILGSGEARYQQAVEALGKKLAGKVSVLVKFDEALAHRIEAGSDFFVMPSRYEPCGLNQIYSLRYGTIPIVRRTGGLADTIIDGETGFAFGDFKEAALLEAIQRARTLYKTPARHEAMMKTGMTRDFSWTASAREYLKLFGSLRQPAPVPAGATSRRS